ncbi:MAG TPA: hypothetical protein VNM37_07540, partial [Candidatus Dormibacteraeota bacterium]|nr:hypothetical protein [Candidatus Dormibacteraeota bacterium]
MIIPASLRGFRPGTGLLAANRAPWPATAERPDRYPFRLTGTTPPNPKGITMTASDTTTKTVKYATAVKRGLAASKSADKAQWIIGDLAATVDTSEYGAGTVQRFSDDIGRAYKTVLDMRKVASQYAPAERSDLNSWTIHQIFGRQEDRAKLVKSQAWTASAAKALVESRKNPGNEDEGNEGNEGNEPATAETDAEKLT